MMDFGKYKDRPVEDVPTSYLEWCLRKCECLRPWLRRAIEAVLHDRGRAEPEPVPALPDLAWVVSQWYREMALRFHPDRGGDVQVMQALNSAHERLKELLGV